MSPLPLSAGALAELRALCAAAQRDPSLLHDASLADLRALLRALGATLPPAPATPAPATSSSGAHARPGGDEDLRDEECVAPDAPSQEMGPPAGGDEPSEQAQAAAAEARDAAAQAAASGDWEAAVTAYTTAIKAAPSALLYAKRGECFLKLKRPNAAIKDADAALALNPDSARALRVRGLAHRLLGAWEAAAADLGAAQSIDFSEEVVAPLKLVLDKAAVVRKRRVIAENAEKLRRQEESARAAREAAAAAAAAASAGTVRHIGDGSAFKALLAEAAAAGKPVLVDFFATWCGPCKMISPVIEQMARDTPGVVFAKVDVDACQDVARAAGVTAMPTFQLFKNGAKVNELRGADAAALKRMVQAAL